MTDNEIIKVLECCTKTGCSNCPLYTPEATGTCVKRIMFGAIDLINRQNAEIDTLKAERNNYKEWYLSLANEVNKYPCKTVVGNNSEIHSKTAKDYDNLIADIKSDTIKAFAEILTNKIVNTQSVFSVQKVTHDFLSGNVHRQQEILDYIYNLVKEMTEGKGNA